MFATPYEPEPRAPQPADSVYTASVGRLLRGGLDQTVDGTQVVRCLGDPRGTSTYRGGGGG